MKPSSHIPSFDIIPRIKGRTRYSIGAAVSQVQFTSVDLHNAVGIVATTSILGNPISQMARLLRVEIWAPAITGASPSPGSCAIKTLNSSNSAGNPDSGFWAPPKTVQDATTSADEPAHVIFTPLRNTLAGAWHSPNQPANSVNLFQITATAGAVMDVWYEYIPNWETPNNNTVTMTQTLVGATAGQVYKRALAASSSVSPFNEYVVI